MKINIVSSLDLIEVACLIAKYKSLDKKQEDLSRYTEEQIKAIQVAKRFEEVHLDFKFTKDLHELTFSSFDFVLNAYRLFKQHGILPFPSSLSEQPNKIIECFNILSALDAEEMQRQMKKKKHG